MYGSRDGLQRSVRLIFLDLFSVANYSWLAGNFFNIYCGRFWGAPQRHLLGPFSPMSGSSSPVNGLLKLAQCMNHICYAPGRRIVFVILYWSLEGNAWQNLCYVVNRDDHYVHIFLHNTRVPARLPIHTCGGVCTTDSGACDLSYLCRCEPGLLHLGDVSVRAERHLHSPVHRPGKIGWVLENVTITHHKMWVFFFKQRKLIYPSSQNCLPSYS